ncbi:MAG: Bax inhibitor-1/YccA family protein [Pseudomonadota bacterium]
MVNPNYAQGTAIGQRAAAVDAGLKAHMNSVYALMTGAMVLTGLVAYVVGMDLNAVVDYARANGGQIAGADTALLPPSIVAAMFSSPIKWVVMFAPLIFVFAFSAMIYRMSTATAQTVFWIFGAVMGLSIAHIFAVFTGVSIAQTFFATAAGFGALSLYGYTTKKDLSGWGSFLFMGLISLIIVSLLNIFIFESSALQWAISGAGVLLFAALTAYDTQSIKNEYLELRGTPGGEAVLEKGAVLGALRLYLDFLNMFMFLLQFMGNRE